MRRLCEEIELASNYTVTVTAGAVCRWESGQREVALRYRPFIAEALGIPVSILFENPPVMQAAA